MLSVKRGPPAPEEPSTDITGRCAFRRVNARMNYKSNLAAVLTVSTHAGHHDCYYCCPVRFYYTGVITPFAYYRVIRAGITAQQ